MNTNEWIEGPPPRMSRNPVQIEREGGVRVISLCPACGANRSTVKELRHRPISDEVKQAYINGVARNESPYGKPGNNQGERLKSYCCGSDMVIMRDQTYLCLHCLEPAPTASEIVKNQPSSK